MLSEGKKNNRSRIKNSKLIQPLDLVALGTILVLSMGSFIIFQWGDRNPSQVVGFSWNNKQAGVNEREFTLTFNRPVDRSSVEKNLQIEPLLPGKISWSGKTLHYTLTQMPIYGIDYKLNLQGAKEFYGRYTINHTSDKKTEKGMATLIEPYTASFSTRDLVFAYLGVEGEEKGRLLLYNLNEKKKKILTPTDLLVTKFEIYPDGEKILFTAFDRNINSPDYIPQQLYTVTTGLNFQSEDKKPVGKIKLILDAKQYQNLKFDLSADGSTIVVQRINWDNQAESSLWVLPSQAKSRPLGIQGNKFLLAPDGQKLAVIQKQGVVIVPLTEALGGSSQFLPNYTNAIGFSADGENILTVRENQDYTRSLFLVSFEGLEKELFRTVGTIDQCLFEPRQQRELYCLTTNLVPTPSGYEQEPSLSAIDLKTGEDSPILALTNYKEVNLSMSADGLSLLFDQIVTTNTKPNDLVLTDSGKAISAGNIWILSLSSLQSEDNPEILYPPQALISGFKPRWVP